MWSVMRRLSPFDFYRTVDFIYVDFNLLPHMKNCHTHCSLPHLDNSFWLLWIFQVDYYIRCCKPIRLVL